MSLNDPLSNVLSQIHHYEKLGKKLLVTKDNNKVIKEVLKIMKEHRYVGAIEEVEDSKGNTLKIHLIKNINKTGVIKPRFGVDKDSFEKFEKQFLPSKDFGIIIVSTSKGMMTHKEAKKQKIGGKLISYCY